MTIYESYVQKQNAEEILQQGHAADSNFAPYLQVAAQVRSNQDLIGALKQASTDSGKVALRITLLTAALVAVGVAQTVAIAWPYLAWWWGHH